MKILQNRFLPWIKNCEILNFRSQMKVKEGVNFYAPFKISESKHQNIRCCFFPRAPWLMGLSAFTFIYFIFFIVFNIIFAFISILTHQSHISQISSRYPNSPGWHQKSLHLVTDKLTDITSRASCDAKNLNLPTIYIRRVQRKHRKNCETLFWIKQKLFDQIIGIVN